jgi:hypothetical protein
MHKLTALADHLCALVAELTSHRLGPGPHWLMVETIARELRRHGVTVTGDELAGRYSGRASPLRAEEPSALDQPMAKGLEPWLRQPPAQQGV